MLFPGMHVSIRFIFAHETKNSYTLTKLSSAKKKFQSTMSSGSFQNLKNVQDHVAQMRSVRKKGYKALITHVLKGIQIARFVEFVTHTCRKPARATTSRSLAQGLPITRT